MLSIKPVGSTSTEVNYYANLGEVENHDYYTEDGNRPGVWWGPGADALGLTGNVTPAAFKNLLEGLSPDGERELVQRRIDGKVKRRAGFDLTFSVPKSFSAAWSQADRETRQRMDERARMAVNETLTAVQELCGMTRRGKNTHIVEAAKLTFAIFSHDTARGVPGRVPDANRHFHAVCPNVTIRDDGSGGTIDARHLFKPRMKMALGAMFRAELSKGMEELGLKTERPKKARSEEKVSWFELSAVPKELTDAMSKRRKEIEKWLRKHGLSGAKASEKAALVTRQAKEKYSQKELFEEWQRLGREHGFTFEDLKKELTGNQPCTFSKREEQRAAVSRALDALMQKKARFTEIELLELTAVESQCRGLGVKEIREAVSFKLENSPQLVRLKSDNSGTRTYTTLEMLELEKRMLREASFLGETSSHAVSFQDANSILNAYPSLRNEQAQAVRHATTGFDLACVQGVAGSGKTFMLGVVRKVFERAGYEVLGTSLAAKAARGLEEGSGIRSVHIHKLLKDIEQKKTSITKHTVLIVDEAGMVGTRQMQKLVSLVSKNNAKLVLVGDWDQIQAVDAGSAFRGISKEVGYASMDSIVRQREEWARDVVQDLRRGRAIEALTEFQSRGQLFIGEDRDAAMDELVGDWSDKTIGDSVTLKESLVFAGTNLEVRELNKRIQNERLEAGELGESTIELDGLDVHVSDRLMVTRNYNSLGLQNGTLGTVVSLEGGIVGYRLDNGFTFEIDVRDFDHLTLGYAMTTHKGQGVTCENAFVLTGDGMTDRELSYVQGSRARGFTKLYSDELSGGETIQELALKVGRSRQKVLAYEYQLEAR